MKINHKNPGKKKTSRTASAITITIFLCLLLTCRAFVISADASQSDRTDQNNGSASEDSSSDSLPRRFYDWLGIDAILSILNPEDTDAAAKTDSHEDTASADDGTKETGTDSSDTDEAGEAGSAEDSGTGKTASADSTAEKTAAGSGETDSKDSGTKDSDSKTESSGKESSAKDTSAKESSAKDTSAKEASEKDTSAKEASEKESTEKDASEKKASENDSREASMTKLQKKYVEAWEEWHMRDFKVNFPLHNYNWKYLKYDESGNLRYEGDENYTIRHGIDVSEFQGSIDWKKVKKAGYDFVFVRAGHRTLHTGTLEKDSRAVKNITRAKKAGLDVGVYVFSQAITEEEAVEEAELCLDVIEESGVEITLPVVFDPEIVIEDYYARINYISGKQFTDNAVAFCKTVKKAGYTPAIYANCSTQTDILDMSRLEGNTIWYADYGTTPETPYDFTFWQYSNLGWVDGIPETETDLNVWFVKNNKE